MQIFVFARVQECAQELVWQKQMDNRVVSIVKPQHFTNKCTFSTCGLYACKSVLIEIKVYAGCLIKNNTSLYRIYSLLTLISLNKSSNRISEGIWYIKYLESMKKSVEYNYWILSLCLIHTRIFKEKYS